MRDQATCYRCNAAVCSLAFAGMSRFAGLSPCPCALQQVPQSAIGSIIGSGGSNINRIRQETGAKIKVFDEPVRDAPFVALLAVWPYPLVLRTILSHCPLRSTGQALAALQR